LVDRMYAMTKESDKIVRSFANEAMYSAAYSIGSIGDKIIVGRTGGVGSIGVVTSHVDFSKYLDDLGVRITFVFAGSHKVDGNPYEPLKASVKARIQKRIDDIYSIFVATVARNRGMDEQAIRDTEALCYSANDAVAIGLADKVGPMDTALAEFAASLKPDQGDFPIMTKTAAELAADKATADKATTDAAAADQARKEADIKAAADKEGRTAAKARISGILALDEAKKRPDAAHAVAMDTEMSIEDAKAFLAKLPEEKSQGAGVGGELFNKLMDKDNPDLGKGGDKDKTDKTDRVEDVLNAQAATHGFKREKKAA
jgi:ClpP class serine protease